LQLSHTAASWQKPSAGIQRWGNHFRGDRRIWAGGYFVNTVGLDEAQIRRYVKSGWVLRYQEDKERQDEQDHRQFELFE
jgi:REP element-mobilizing transposase RayT